MTQAARKLVIGDLLALAPVIPVLTIARIEDAVPLARALAAGGLGVLEVTLRTPAALEAIARIKAELPSAIVGAGTILTPADMAAASEAGADFLVSPGATRASGRRRQTTIAALPAGRGNRQRSHAVAGARFSLSEILSSRSLWRSGRSESIARPARRYRLLPDRRHHGGQCARLSRARQRGLRRRELASTRYCDQIRGMVSDRSCRTHCRWP